MGRRTALITGFGRTAGIGAGTSRALAVPADLADPCAVEHLMEYHAQEAGTLHGWVLSPSESVDSGILHTSLEACERHFAVNARAGWPLIAAFARQAAPDGGFSA